MSPSAPSRPIYLRLTRINPPELLLGLGALLAQPSEKEEQREHERTASPGVLGTALAESSSLWRVWFKKGIMNDITLSSPPPHHLIYSGSDMARPGFWGVLEGKNLNRCPSLDLD